MQVGNAVENADMQCMLEMQVGNAVANIDMRTNALHRGVGEQSGGKTNRHE